MKTKKRRKTRSLKEKLEILQDFRNRQRAKEQAPGRSVAAKYGVSMASIYTWDKQEKQGVLGNRTPLHLHDADTTWLPEDKVLSTTGTVRVEIKDPRTENMIMPHFCLCCGADIKGAFETFIRENNPTK